MNLAARLTDAAKHHPARLLVAARSVAAAGAEEASHWVPSTALEVRGVDEPVEVCEPR